MHRARLLCCISRLGVSLRTAGPSCPGAWPQVKAAVFSMIQARLGGSPTLPQGSRWLDLFAGTGNIGLEVRGAPWRAASWQPLCPVTALI